MLNAIPFVIVLATACFAQSVANDETQVWSLEKAYSEYVKTNDLEKYRTLWHENFVGWPFVSSAPVRKDQITDWITINTSIGVKLQSYLIEQLAIQVTGDVAINYYRIKANWPRAKESKSGRTHCGSCTPGSGLMAHGRSSAACPRP
jgi:hypothetical protein